MRRPATSVGAWTLAACLQFGGADALLAQTNPPSAVAVPAASPTIAVLQALDKVTGRVRVVEAPLDQLVRFEALEITVRACRKRPPEEPPESAAFLEIIEARTGRPRREVFVGWMFASSPGVSALEHPGYDVWVIDCRTGR